MNLLVSLLLLVSTTAFANVEYDGTDDMQSCGTSDVITENGAITICWWANRNGAGGGGNARILQRGSVVLFLTGTGSLSYEFQVAGTTTLRRATANSTITADTWEHWCVKWDGSTTAANADIFKNGTETTYQATVNGATLTNNSTDTLYIGNRADGLRAWDGFIDEFAVWSSQLSNAEIAHLAASRTRGLPLQISPSSLKYYLPFDECAEGAACATASMFRDRSGQGNHCSPSNNPTGRGGAILSYP